MERRYWRWLGWGLGGLLAGAAAAGGYVLYVCVVPPPPTPTPVTGPAQGLRQAVTQAAGRVVERHIESRARSTFLRTDLTNAQIIARFADPRTPLAVRRLDGWRMAERIGSPEALAALRRALEHGSPEIRGIAAEALGHGRWPEAREWLLALLNDPEPAVVLGAIRGLAAWGDKVAVARLQLLLCDGEARLEYRLEIAWRLGELESPQALLALRAGFQAAADDDLVAVLLDSLGKQEFAATSDLFVDLLADTAAPTATQVRAADALAGSDADALPLLAETAASHPDAEVRAAAAWALGVNRETGAFGPQLAAQLATESEADVRRRLYEALLRQQQIPLALVWAQAELETDPAARIAAANALAAGLRGSATPPADQTRFDSQLVAELEHAALSTTSVNLRLRAVFALWRAGTPGAVAALYRIRDGEQPKVATAAQHALSALGLAPRP